MGEQYPYSFGKYRMEAEIGRIGLLAFGYKYKYD